MKKSEANKSRATVSLSYHFKSYIWIVSKKGQFLPWYFCKQYNFLFTQKSVQAVIPIHNLLCRHCFFSIFYLRKIMLHFISCMIIIICFLYLLDNLVSILYITTYACIRMFCTSVSYMYLKKIIRIVTSGKITRKYHHS
jgi:hypothetical protein